MKFSTSTVIAVLATGVLATPAKETNIFSSIENERSPAQDTQPTANMKSGEMALLICGRNKACRLMTNNGSCCKKISKLLQRFRRQFKLTEHIDSLDTWWADDRVATLDLNIMPTNTCCFYQQVNTPRPGFLPTL